MASGPLESFEPPSQAKFWGIDSDELRILFLITHWFNGLPMVIHDEKRRIGTHHDPSLADMFNSVKWDYSDHEDAHERLLSNNILEEEYVCRRKVDWSPTEQGIRAIRDSLKPWAEKLQPHWAEDRDKSGPIFGDPNESLIHRKGVEVAAHALTLQAWAFDIHSRCYGYCRYPSDSYDFVIESTESMDNVGVEVITNHNNTEHIVEKWRRLAKSDRITLWLFDGRDTACKMFNALDRRNLVFLDGGQFKNPGNWSAQAINQKLWRSETDIYGTEIEDLVHTVTGILETDNRMMSDDSTMYDLFKGYYDNASK